MSGILEQSISRIDQLEAQMQQLCGMIANTQTAQQQYAPAPAQQQYAPAPAQQQYQPQPAATNFGLGALAPAQPASAQQVTPEMIQTLIMPMVANEQVKAALSAQMQAMGITNLPDAHPNQLPELYARFQQVAQQFSSAQAAAPAAAPSII